MLWFPLSLKERHSNPGLGQPAPPQHLRPLLDIQFSPVQPSGGRQAQVSGRPAPAQGGSLGSAPTTQGGSVELEAGGTSREHSASHSPCHQALATDTTTGRGPNLGGHRRADANPT